MPTILLTTVIPETMLFRLELIERLIAENYRVVVSCTDGPLVQRLRAAGCEHQRIKINRRGRNAFGDISVFLQYLRIIKKTRPDIVLTYTVKPNIYASLACRLLRTPYINNITGLGVIGQKGIMQKLLFMMQRVAFKRSSCVFFQNQSDYDLYRSQRICGGFTRLIPGSGVNVSRFVPTEYPSDQHGLRFLTVGRIRRDKGYDDLFAAVKMINRHEFHIAGAVEDGSYAKKTADIEREYPVVYHGPLEHEEIRELIAQSHCLIHPSHSEGMANVVLESASSARPVIASDIPGCRESVEDGATGYLYPSGDVAALAMMIERFASLPHEQRRQMGLAGRKKIESEFNRNIVIDAYMEEITKCLGEQR
ncbi:MAG: glycosyltransferase family 4 protein [Oscillospiraceae bacterium]|nr:glycosyltransferase family 4 protein [Oscillospiraceae bacterium]